ncbi:MAG: hypothetical protein H6739_33950 [Alphaproteobacteria bacterium]|nr:hypothetical protein [Alphaproteobacteria bacterium]
MTPTRTLSLAAAALTLGLALACGRGKDEPVDSDSAGADDSEDVPLTAEDMPADPSPFTLTLSGGWNTTLTFDQPTCSNPTGSSNLRVFWRGSSHVAVLVLDLLGTYEGAGTYTTAADGARVRIQEEAGGSGYYFGTTESDSIEAEVLYADEDIAWGTYTVSGFSDGGLTIEPTTIPIWCPEFT